MAERENGSQRQSSARKGKNSRKPTGHYGLYLVLLSAVLIGAVLLVTGKSAPDGRPEEPVFGEEILDDATEEPIEEPEEPTDSLPALPVSAEAFPDTLAAFAESRDIPFDVWTEDMVEVGQKNPEIQSFILQYPLLRDVRPEIDLEEYRNAEEVPLLMQWDPRWGYCDYAGGIIGMSGCGPTCLSMVAMYLLNDPSLDPLTVAEFSTEHRYYEKNNGSLWTLISKGGVELGLSVKEVPLDKNILFRHLKAGEPVIAVMGPGDFTEGGHYIVMTGVQDGKITVNDPNSRERSGMLWEYERVESQIRNIWACTLPEGGA